MTDLAVTLFADFTCPYSYVTEASLERLIRSGIQFVPRAYELFPEPASVEPLHLSEPDAEKLRRIAAEVGVPLEPPRSRPRTGKAHELSRFGREHGREADLRRAIYAAYWSEGLDIGRIDVLAGLAEGVGLDPEDARIALDIDRFTAAVEHDREVAGRLGIPGTPTIYVGSGHSASVRVGALGISELRHLIDESLRYEGDVSEDV